jgi:hypothetical protein
MYCYILMYIVANMMLYYVLIHGYCFSCYGPVGVVLYIFIFQSAFYFIGSSIFVFLCPILLEVSLQLQYCFMNVCTLKKGQPAS